MFGHYCWNEAEVEKAKREILGEKIQDQPKEPKVKKPKAPKKKKEEEVVFRPTYTTSYGCSGRLTYDQDGKPVGVRAIVYARDGNRCLKCGTDKNLSLDEIVPKSKGGKRSVENCQTLCVTCNGEKGSRTIDYRKK